ncbi:hypothetical protein SAMN04488057_101238 [Cyclobacterium lianum]|uniref:META domain-containing protein n=1 Tax=Cyclobacterium lianum TaxID=388280 RepID=A0A1M7I8E7_9BACT|nr:hypothetical protein [Cyclobacterium lianum]SHM36975.1 hypothetical protein SAMN04488057_101238 [Cyclobacterium lianum]
MKKVVVSKSRWMVLVGMVFLIPVLGGCQDEELPEGEIRLSQIPDNPDYTSLPLIGTTWKLIGFVDEGRNRVKLPEPDGESTYLLKFNGNGEISGRTSTNSAYGRYLLGSDGLLEILTFTNTTELNELFDGGYYIASLNDVFSFALSPKGLTLYYDSEKSMLFQPQ